MLCSSEQGGLAVKFDADEWAVLTPSERVYRCRSWATEAQARAEKAASPELKQTYQSMADQWATLAREIEHQSNLGVPREER
jgi:hypothetical protein